MAFVSDKLYNGYLRRNMAAIVSRVKPIEIMVHLPCLTAHDREVIQAKTETRGKFDGMMCLLDCLKRREQWPEQLIQALEACEHTTLAAEIRAEYNALMGLDNSSSSSPPTTVVRAHVHPAPSANPLQLPTGAAVSRPAEAPEAEAPEAEAPEAEAPEAEAPEAEAPEAEAPEAEAPAAEAPEALPAQPSVSPPEPVLQPPQAAQIEVPPPPSTPPVSPETPHRQETPNPHQQPEENLESDPDQNVKMHHPEDDEQPQRPPSPPPSAFCVTPEKHPVQDTTPPLVKVLTEETSEPSTEQVVGTTPDEPGLRPQDDSVCLSKPLQLVSIQPPNPSCPTLLAPTVSVQPPAQSSLSQPYSGSSDRLEISQPAPDMVPAGSALICQENGVAHSSGEPEENHYDSPTSSFSTQEVLVNVVQVSEEPSILNLQGQTSSSHAQINGEVAKDAALSPQLSSANIQSHLSSESSATAEHADPEALQSPAPQTQITKYVMTAAGVGACALLVAWRFRN